MILDKDLRYCIFFDRYLESHFDPKRKARDRE